MKPTHKTLAAYQKSYALATSIFNISLKFPVEEKYSLTDQVRRSSRSVCVQIAEAYRRRQYPKDFAHKLSIGDGELAETSTWLDFALDCKYISDSDHKTLIEQTDEAGKLLGYMMNNPGKFGVGS